MLAGNSIHQDRRFIRRYMPALDAAPALPDGRRLDDQGARRAAGIPQIIAKQPAKKEGHRALDDIRESIDELRWYKQHLFVQPATRPATPA